MKANNYRNFEIFSLLIKVLAIFQAFSISLMTCAEELKI